MATQSLPYVTPEQYLEYDRKADVESEYLFGVIMPMTAVTPRHSLISANVVYQLKERLPGTSCRVFNTGLRVCLDPKRGYVYPDLTVVCGQVEYLDGKRDTITNPKVAVEVLSPSTQSYDLGIKARLYWKVPSLTELIFIEQDKIAVEYWTRLPNGKWDRTLLESAGDILKIETANCEIPIREFYDGVESPPADEAA